MFLKKIASLILLLSLTSTAYSQQLCHQILTISVHLELEVTDSPQQLKNNPEATKQLILWLNQAYKSSGKMGNWGHLNTESLNFKEMTTGELAVLGHQIIQLSYTSSISSYERYQASQKLLHRQGLQGKEFKSHEKNLEKVTALPEEVIDAFFPSLDNYSYEDKLKEVLSLDSSHPLSQTSKKILQESKATQNGFNDLSTSNIFTRDLTQIMDALAVELSKRPVDERRFYLDEYSQFEEEIWRQAVSYASEARSGFPSSTDPRVRASRALNFYLDALLLGFYGPKSNYEVNQKIQDNPLNAQTYAGLPYEEITTSWANLRFIYKRLNLDNQIRTIIDLGTAFGRPGHALSFWHPHTHFLGFDIVAERITTANQVSDMIPNHNSSFEVKNFATEEIPSADVYFLYEPATKRDTIRVVNKIRDTVKEKTTPTYIVAVGATGVLIPVLEKRKWLKGKPHIYGGGQYVAHLYEVLKENLEVTPEQSRLTESLSLASIKTQDIELSLKIMAENLSLVKDIYSVEVEQLLLKKSFPKLEGEAKQHLGKILDYFGFSSGESIYKYYQLTGVTVIPDESQGLTWPDQMYFDVIHNLKKEDQIYPHQLDRIPTSSSLAVQNQITDLLMSMNPSDHYFLKAFLKNCIRFQCPGEKIVQKLKEAEALEEDKLAFFDRILSYEVLPESKDKALIQYLQSLFNSLYSSIKKDLVDQGSKINDIYFLIFCNNWKSFDCKGLDQVAFDLIDKVRSSGLGYGFKKLLVYTFSPLESKFRKSIYSVLSESPDQNIEIISELKKWGFNDLYNNSIDKIKTMSIDDFNWFIRDLEKDDFNDPNFKKIILDYIAEKGAKNIWRNENMYKRFLAEMGL